MPGWWSLDEIDAEWIREVLRVRDAHSWDVETVTSGRITRTGRLRVTGDDGSVMRFVVKSADPGWDGPIDPLVREHRFHTAAHGGSLPISPCLADRLDPDARVYWLVFADAGPGAYGRDLAGPAYTTSFLAMASIARVHRAVDPAEPRPSWLEPTPVPDRDSVGEDYVRFVQQYGERLDPVHLSIANQVVASIGTLTDHAGRLGARIGVVHGDMRSGNLIFGGHRATHPVVISNWNHVGWGPCVVDVASYLALSLPVDVRRASYDELLHRYLVAMDAPVGPERLDALRREIHDHAFLVLVQVLRRAVETPRWETSTRGATEVWPTLFARACEFLDDLGRPSSTPARARPVPEPLPGDEFPHPEAVGDGRSEEWILAVADAHEGVGAWVRFGRHTGLDEGAYVAVSITGPDIPPVWLTALTPGLDESLSLRTPDVHMEHTVVEPFRHVHLRLTGRGHAAGADVDIAMDLHAYASARPALYGVSPLLLVPSVVTGTITVSGLGPTERRFPVDAPGYREHAWAGTDWWDMRWTAFTAHFDDGSDMNGLDIRVRGLAPMSLGHLQSTTTPPILLDVCRVLQGPDEIDATWTFALEPGSHTLTFTPVSGAPVLRPGGAAETLIRRVWGTFTRNDGHTGIGWVESEPQPVTPDGASQGVHDPTASPPNL
ncbi:phosphotransferase [Williamsia sp. SKLECPSW1]